MYKSLFVCAYDAVGHTFRVNGSGDGKDGKLEVGQEVGSKGVEYVERVGEEA